MSTLTKKRCVPCEAGTPPLEPAKVHEFLGEVPEWDVIDDEVQKIGRTWKFKNFVQAMAFTYKVADLAENEGHHPDIHISYSRVSIELWTHAAGGLTENDFILAAKIDELSS